MGDHNSYVTVGSLISKINSIKGESFFSTSIKNGYLPILSGEGFNFVPYITKDDRILSKSLLNQIVCHSTIKRCKEYAKQIGWDKVVVVEDTDMTEEKFNELLDKHLPSRIGNAILDTYNLIVIYHNARFYIKRYSSNSESFIIEEFDYLGQVKERAKALAYRKITLVSEALKNHCSTMDLTSTVSRHTPSPRPIDGPSLFKLVENMRGEKIRMDKSVLNSIITVDKVSFTPIGEFIAMLNITF